MNTAIGVLLLAIGWIFVLGAGALCEKREVGAARFAAVLSIALIVAGVLLLR